MTYYDSKTLFSMCALCEGTGIVPEELSDMGKCICDGSGYISSGLTTSQFDLYKQRAEAAPDLLAACEAALQALTPYVHGDQTEESVAAYALHDAIAKAKGE